MKQLAIALIMLGMPMLLIPRSAAAGDGEILAYTEAMINELTRDDDRAHEAYGKLLVMRDLDAVAAVRAHLDDQRKTSFGYEILGAVSCEDPCPPPDLRVGDVCYLVLTAWLEGEMPRCCRYFEYYTDKEEVLSFLDAHEFASFADLQLKAAEHAYRMTEEKGYLNEDYEHLYLERIEELKKNVK